jgi:hypothetical protein
MPFQYLDCHMVPLFIQSSPVRRSLAGESRGLSLYLMLAGRLLLYGVRPMPEEVCPGDEP